MKRLAWCAPAKRLALFPRPKLRRGCCCQNMPGICPHVVESMYYNLFNIGLVLYSRCFYYWTDLNIFEQFVYCIIYVHFCCFWTGGSAATANTLPRQKSNRAKGEWISFEPLGESIARARTLQRFRTTFSIQALKHVWGVWSWKQEDLGLKMSDAWQNSGIGSKFRYLHLP